VRVLGLLARVVVIVVCILAVQEPRALMGPQAIIRGDAAYRQGQSAEAAADYQAALAAQPGDAAIIQRLIDTAQTAHRPDLAHALLEQTAAWYGWTPALNHELADVFLAQGDHQQASVYLQASLSGSREDIPALRKLVDFDLAERDWRAAVEMLTRLITIDPADEHALYQLGLLLAPTDAPTAVVYLGRAAADPQYRQAVAAVESVIAAHGQDAPAALAFQIGLALMSLRAWPYAEYSLGVSLERGLDNPAALAFLGVAQDQQGRDGWPMIEKALNAAPDDPTVNYAVALHWRLAGDASKALAVLLRAQALDPRNAALAAEIGLAYQMLGRFVEASSWLNKAVELAPGNAGFRTLLATFYVDSDYNLAGEGLDTIRRLAALAPDDAEIRASLGWALFSTRQFDAARVEVEKALTLDPTNLRARYYLAVYLEYRGDREGASDSYLYVYRANGAFRELAAGALRRLGYRLDPR
jgi:Flp pilus assembly protein TadD